MGRTWKCKAIFCAFDWNDKRDAGIVEFFNKYLRAIEQPTSVSGTQTQTHRNPIERHSIRVDCGKTTYWLVWFRNNASFWRWFCRGENARGIGFVHSVLVCENPGNYTHKKDQPNIWRCRHRRCLHQTISSNIAKSFQNPCAQSHARSCTRVNIIRKVLICFWGVRCRGKDTQTHSHEHTDATLTYTFHHTVVRSNACVPIPTSQRCCQTSAYDTQCPRSVLTASSLAQLRKI